MFDSEIKSYLETDMKKLITIAVLGLSLSGIAAANDRVGDFSWAAPSMAQPYDGQTVGRADYPKPAATVSKKDGTVSISKANDRAGIAS
jgi:hypothetical protein